MITRRGVIGGAVSAATLFRPSATPAAIKCDPPVSGVVACEVGVSIGDIETARQRCDEWCWAACIQTVFAVYGRNIDQETAVKKIFGTTVCRPATPEQIVQAVAGLWKDDSGASFAAFAERLPNTSLHDFGYLLTHCRDKMFGCSNNTGAEVDKRVISELRGGHPLIIGALGHATVLTAASYLQTDKSTQLSELNRA